ncbi:MAG TPA: malic enzyme-like NAD(P)-binding protein [Candidatus Saccharimonadia bacterium]
MTHRIDPLKLHRDLQGKLAVTPKTDLTPDTLAALYTPGVGQVSSYVAEHPADAAELTLKGRSVAVVSDGSAVLGLGNIGPLGALPVMEGKAILFKALGGLDAWPLVLSTQDPAEIIAAVKAVAPTFGGINLEDISAPRCYEIEERLQAELDIPVMHDDQHATAIVALAGLINAFKIVEKDLKKAKIAVVGAGAAGSAILRLLLDYGVEDVVMTDSKGIVEPGRPNLDPYKQRWAQLGNPRHLTGDAAVAIQGADAVVAVSVPGSVTAGHVAAMADRPVVFALSNPTPEIMPADALAAGAAVVATGRSDFPNQINNVLVFPGLFKGLLAAGARDVTPAIKLRAAQALAALVPQPTAEHIIPSALDPAVPAAVARAVSPA